MAEDLNIQKIDPTQNMSEERKYEKFLQIRHLFYTHLLGAPAVFVNKSYAPIPGKIKEVHIDDLEKGVWLETLTGEIVQGNVKNILLRVPRGFEMITSYGAGDKTMWAKNEVPLYLHEIIPQEEQTS